MKRLLVLFPCMCMANAHAVDTCPTGYIAIDRPEIVIATDDVCPDGYISAGTVTSCSSASPGGDCMVFSLCPPLPDNAYWSDESTCTYACNDGYSLTFQNQCAQLCTAGFTKIHTSLAVVVPLYSAKITDPAIHVKSAGGTTCYGNLETGSADDAINVNYNGTTYHSVN